MADLAAALTGLVGYRAAAGFTLPPGLLESRSGLRVQDKNELLALDVLQHAVPDGETIGDWLARLTQGALQDFVPALRGAQSLTGKVVLADGVDATGQPAPVRLVKNPGRKDEGVNKLGQFVGLELRLTRHPGVAYTLPAISLQLDGALTQKLTLYLYTDTQAEPLATFDVPTGNRPYFPALVPLNNIDLDAGQQNPLWLGYYEDDLPLAVRAIRGVVGPCGCLDDVFPLWHPYARVRPFAIPADALDADRELFDYRTISYGGGSFGLNPYLLGVCDLATALGSESNQTLLAPAVLLAVCIRLLEAISTTSNITQVTARQDVQADAIAWAKNYQAQLYGGVDSAGTVWPGLLGSVVLDFTGLDALCRKAEFSPILMGQIVR